MPIKISMKKDSRRPRISVFSSGQSLSDCCLRHFAPKTAERALIVCRRERKKCPEGGKVILHYGNLKKQSYKIVAEYPRWTEADELAAKITAFSDFEELLSAPAYFPSLNCEKADCARLADLYDQAQEQRGDCRRAYRYGDLVSHPVSSVKLPKKILSTALSLCCLAAVTGCARPDLGQPTYRISREESVAILRAGLPADSDQDQDGIPDSLDPAPHGSGLSDGGSQL